MSKDNQNSITPEQALEAFRTLWPSVQKMRKRTDDTVVIYRDYDMACPPSEIIFLPSNRIAWGESKVCHAGIPSAEAENMTALEQRPPRIGDRIKITKDIDWDGEDCHPPCILAHKGDMMHVRRIRGYNVMACHNLLDQSTMLVQQGEYEICKEQ